MKTAIILGVGPLDGLGSQLCQRYGKTHHVLVGGRTAEKIELTVKEIEKNGGSAQAVVTDATNEADVKALVDQAGDQLDVAVYNAGNNMPGKIAEMTTEYFENAWRIGCLGGFMFGRDAINSFLKSGGGTLLFTGASASLRGRSGFGAFNSAKSGLRIMAMAMAKEYAADNIHVGHVVIDGPIGGEKIKTRFPDRAAELGEAGMISIQGLVDGYQFLHNQPANAWTFELDMRTSKENW